MAEICLTHPFTTFFLTCLCFDVMICSLLFPYLNTQCTFPTNEQLLEVFKWLLKMNKQMNELYYIVYTSEKNKKTAKKENESHGSL